jgi:DNA polymerase-3 subunit delta'
MVLLATSLDNVLPTIVSRCQVVNFGLAPIEAIAEALTLRRGVAPDVALDAAFRSQGRFGRAFELAGEAAPAPVVPELPASGEVLAWSDALAARPEPEQKAALDELLTLMRDAALASSGAEQAPLRHAERARAIAPYADVTGWLHRARRVEEAREKLERHANARLVFDELARALVLDGN